MGPLRVVTYLAPSIPERFFALVTEHLGRHLGVATSLSFVTDVSGPCAGDDPFSSDEADVGFVCAPSVTSVDGRLDVLAAPVYADARCAGRPVYYVDVLVAADAPVDLDLSTARWAYNDDRSLSGYLSVRERLGPRFGGRFVRSGSHLRSIALVANGEVDAAGIDSHVLTLATAADPALRDRVRVAASWGPYPVQPFVARPSLDAGVKDAARTALLGMPTAALHAFGVTRFVEADERSMRAVASVVDGATRARAGGG